MFFRQLFRTTTSVTNLTSLNKSFVPCPSKRFFIDPDETRRVSPFTNSQEFFKNLRFAFPRPGLFFEGENAQNGITQCLNQKIEVSSEQYSLICGKVGRNPRMNPLKLFENFYLYTFYRQLDFDRLVEYHNEIGRGGPESSWFGVAMYRLIGIKFFLLTPLHLDKIWKQERENKFFRLATLTHDEIKLYAESIKETKPDNASFRKQIKWV